MTRVHFADGGHIDINIEYEKLTEQLKIYEKARYIYFGDMTIFIDNITYVEKIAELKKSWEESN